MVDSVAIAGASALVSFFGLSLFVLFGPRSWTSFSILFAAQLGGCIAGGYILSQGVFVLADGTEVAWNILAMGSVVNIVSLIPFENPLEMSFALLGAAQRMFLVVGMLSVKTVARQLLELGFHNTRIVVDDMARTWNAGVTIFAFVFAVFADLLSIILSPFSPAAAGWYFDIRSQDYSSGFDLIFSPLRIVFFGVPTLLLITLVLVAFLSPLIPRSLFAYKWKSDDARLIIFCAIYDISNICTFFSYKLWPVSVQISMSALVDVLALYTTYERSKKKRLERAKEVSKKKE